MSVLLDNTLLEKINTILDPRFVLFDDLAYAMALALSRKKNLWFHGIGGYGKSEMVEAVMVGLGLMEDTFVQAFGQGMTPDKVVGDIDLHSLRQENRIRYKTSESFMSKRFAIFEELPDAALPVLFILKDPLSRKKFRYGPQQEDVITETIIVCSNRSPSYVSEYGVDAAALAQRFPYRKEIGWADHSQKNYRLLLEKRTPMMGQPILDGSTGAYAQLLADVAAKGEPISPRIALDGAAALQGSAFLRKKDKVSEEDFAALAFVAGLEQLGGDVKKKAVEAAKRAAAEGKMMDIERKTSELVLQVNKLDKPIKAFQLSKKLKKLLDTEVSTLAVTDDLANRKDTVIQTIRENIALCYLQGEASTHDDKE